MANNPYVNKVVKADGTTIIDISDTTATAADVLSGKWLHLADGSFVQGTNSGGSGDGYVWQDAQGYVHLSDEEGTQTIIDALTVSSSGTTTAPTGHAYSPVTVPSGTAGTPTATKGTVSSHSVTVTPSVTNSTGWITGSTINGTGVSVSASELVSGTKSISANGTNIDVTNYASVDVAVPSSSPTLITKNITQNGTYNASSDSADGYSSVTVNVSGGGGDAKAVKDVNFIDYDGTIVESYTTAEWANVSALPSNPSHTGLTAQGWNWTKAQIDTQLTSVGAPVWVGQMYVTTSGKTEIDIVLETGRLSPYVGFAVNGTVSIDWGDGSTASTVTGTSLTTAKFTQHNYASAGAYTISLTVTSGSFALRGTSAKALLSANNTTAAVNDVYANRVIAVRIGLGTTILSAYAFQYCRSLETVTIPTNVVTIAQNAMSYCASLKSLTIPNTVTTIGASMCQYCFSLGNVSIPNSVTKVGDYAFMSCYSLKEIVIPNSVTDTSVGISVCQTCDSLTTLRVGSLSILSNAFASCQNLKDIKIANTVISIGASAFSNCTSYIRLTVPENVTSIGNSAFATDRGAVEIHFKSISPPTLGGSGVFTNNSCTIYVPEESLSDYQAADQWSSVASRMVGE